ncbi:MAG: methylenetetrahydrofolate reductase [NAD(P)H] [Bacillota bacterium]|nr:methylenetetrahydrofolate reductase [NAD(P)H] [Bacillota bacterium]
MKIHELLKNRPTLSFEIFPPKNHENDIESIYKTIEELVDLNPDFISVTYGAGGSTSRNTTKFASLIKNKYGVEAVAHLSCINTTKEEIDKILKNLKEENIENILALRGDYPKDGNLTAQDFQYASQLTEYIEETFPNTFCISGACYPETHFEAPDFETDLMNLKKKVDAGAKYVVTQIFFDNQYYYRLVREARKIGIHVPILAGIMPVHNPKQAKRIASMSNCSIPYDLACMIDKFAHSKQAGIEVGLHYATYQIIDLMTNGVDGIHIYTMNKPEIAREILNRTEHLRNEYFKDQTRGA